MCEAALDDTVLMMLTLAHLSRSLLDLGKNERLCDSKVIMFKSFSLVKVKILFQNVNNKA